MGEKFQMYNRFIRSLRASLNRWLSKSPLVTMTPLSKVNATSLLGSRRKQDDSRLVRSGTTKSTTPSVLTSPALTEDTCVCDENGKQDSISPLDHHRHSKRFSARFQLDELSNRSLRHPFRARSSIASKSTAVDSASCTSPSPSSPPPSPSPLKLNSPLRHRSVSPAAYVCHPAFSYPDPRPAICSQPPSQPPPTCPLPSPPPDRPSTGSPSSLRSTLSKASSPGASPLSGSRAGPLRPAATGQRFSHRLQPLATLHNAYPATLHSQALYHPKHDFYDDDPFAAEQLVVSRPVNRSRPAWSDDESVDPLGPIPPHSSRPTSVYTSTSASCYSVNTTVERFARVSLDVTSCTDISQPDDHMHSISISEESQEGPSTPSINSEDEDHTQQSLPTLCRMPIPSPGVSISKRISFTPSPISETISFGLPRRSDGLFFGQYKRPDFKCRAAPAIVLEVSPPVSTTSFSPGDSIRVKVCLASLFDNLVVSFVGESRLLRERKFESHQFLKHEIDLDRSGVWGCWTIERGTSSKDWFVDLKIPTVSNCECSQILCQQYPAELQLPSSTINNQIFISYHLIIRGTGKQKKTEKISSSPKRKKNKLKGEEKVRLTITVKNKNLPNYQIEREHLEAGTGRSCSFLRGFN